MNLVRTSIVLLGAMVFLVAAAEPASAEITRGPYLQRVTPHSIIVRWRTDGPEDSRVEWGTTVGVFDSMADDLAPTTEHKVTVRDLSPSTVYYYRVGSTTTPLAGGDSEHFFKTPPPTGTRAQIRTWFIGDSGFAEPAVLSEQWVRDGDAVRDAYIEFNGGKSTADVWVLTGDSAYNVGSDAEYQKALFEQYEGFVRTVPPWACLGNHEGYSSNGLTQNGPFFDIFSLPAGGEAGGVPSGTESYYSFDYGNIHFVVLDAEDSIMNAAATVAMKQWLEADLAHTTADWVISIWHHPPYTKGLFHDSDIEINEVRMRAHVLPILEAHGHDLGVFGHSHSYERSYLIDGHYGPSDTFGLEHVVDGGTGDPLVDNSYEKPDRGQVPHSGAVYVVAGSASERRPIGAAHPVMYASMSVLGSFILDIDGLTAVGTFLDETGVPRDTFTIEKGTSCPETPTAGCTAIPEARLLMRHGPLPVKDKLVWRAKFADIDDFGNAFEDPIDICMYDANGFVVGGGLPPGEDRWKTSGNGVWHYKNAGSLPFGVNRAKFRVTGIPTGSILAKGKGIHLKLPDFPLTPPVVAQAKNDVDGGCWETSFVAADIVKNDADRFVAKKK